MLRQRARVEIGTLRAANPQERVSWDHPRLRGIIEGILCGAHEPADAPLPTKIRRRR